MPETNAAILKRLLDATAWAARLSAQGYGDTLQHEAFALERDELRAEVLRRMVEPGKVEVISYELS